MIVLDETYRIDADGYQYILYEEGKPDSKGRPTKQCATYHRTLEDAVTRYYRLMEARMIGGDRMSLLEAVMRIRALSESVDALRATITRKE